MNRIFDYQQFVDLYSRTKLNLGRLNSNCLIPGKVLPETIKKGDIYYEEFPTGFVLFSSVDAPFGFYKVFYFFTDFEKFPDIKSDLPLLIEELDSNNKRAKYLESFIPKLESAGFHKSAENNIYEICDINSDIISDYEFREKKLLNDGFTIKSNPDPENFNSIINMWDCYLKQTDVPYEHKQYSQENAAHIVYMVSPGNEICGVNWWNLSNTNCEIRHTVTKPDYYRKGIGTCMILYALRHAYLKGYKTAYTYIDAENDKSINMYQKIGFNKNGKISRQFIKSL